MLLGSVSLILGIFYLTASTAFGALADSPSPNPGTTASVTTNSNGTVTVTLSGTWAWPTHLSDCNLNRFAMGWQVAWGDTTDPGYAIGGSPAGPGGTALPVIYVGSQGNTYNVQDNAVHYDATPPRCGTYNASLGYNTGDWGPISHTYTDASDIPPSICVVNYDMHGSPTDSGPTGNNAIAGGPNHNTDNSYEGNGVANSCATVSITPPVKPDVSIVKTATPSVIEGADITYTITVANDSSVATDNPLTLSDPLPSAVSFVSVTPGSGWSCPSPGQTVTCTYSADLAAGDSASNVVIVAKSLATGTISNTASVVSSDIPIHYSTASTVVSSPAPAALAITKSAVPASGSTVNPNQQITYTLNYANTGGTDVNPATITDTVPAGTSYVAGSAACSPACTTTPSYDASTGALSWSVDAAAGGTGAVSFAVTVNPTDVTNQVITNVGTITGAGQTVTSNKVTHTVFVPVGSLALVKSVTPTTGTAGSTLTYTLDAENPGNVTQNDVVVTDQIPAGTSYVANSAACSTGCSASENPTTGVVSWAVGTLTSGQSVPVSFQVTVNTPPSGTPLPASVTNVGLIGSSTISPPVPSNQVVVPLTGVAGLSLVKSVTPTTATAGTTLTYTLLASATGQVAQDGVMVTDQIPAGTSYVANSAACSTPCSATEDAATGTVTWNVGTLTPGTAVPVTFQVTVNAPAAGSGLPPYVTNVGVISSNTITPVPSNQVIVPLTSLQGLSLVKSVTPATGVAGTMLTYTLDARNTGNVAQNAVTVTDPVPAGTSYVANSAACATPCTASEDPTTGIVTWDVGTLAVGQSMPVTFQVTVNPPTAAGVLATEITNVGMITSTTVSPTPSNEVIVPITAVLGEHFTRTPTTTIPTTTSVPTSTIPTQVLGEQFTQPANAQLPFTGQPLVQEVLIAAVLLGGGLLLLTWPGISSANRRRRTA